MDNSNVTARQNYFEWNDKWWAVEKEELAEEWQASEKAVVIEILASMVIHAHDFKE